MPEVLGQPPPRAALDDRLAHLESRLARIEAQLGLESSAAPAPPEAAGVNGAAPAAPPIRIEDDFEQELGQNGFALAGVIALTIGAVFLLSRPFASLPAALPGAAGLALAGGLLVLAQVAARRLGALAQDIRGAAMVLLFFATLRLFLFGGEPALALGSATGRGVLLAAVALGGVVAWRAGSPWLAGLALVMGCAAGLVIDAGGFLLPLLLALAAAAAAAGHTRGWRAVTVAAIPLVYATYFAWAIGNPFRGGRFHYVTEPAGAPWALLLVAGTFAAAALFRPHRDHEDGVTNAISLLNCVLGYSALLVHSAAAHPGSFAALHATAFLGFLGLAVLFWLRERSRVSTFFYAMTGYLALSMAILKLAPQPDVFVWLSLQSVIVVTTAIWFRSRLIVVANFLIYATIVLGYAFVVRRETGISIGFGLVALVSARILNWQKGRLELKTELMRNAYLLSAFIVFPLALRHLVPGRLVPLAWMALAVAYYGMNLIVRNQKYRWMAHATLGLAGVYLLLPGVPGLDATWRVASFLALGTVLVVVSLAFGRLARRDG